MQPEQLEVEFPGYFVFMNSAEKKGYAGTMILAKKEPLNVHFGLQDGLYNDEGRAITLEYPDFYLVNVYSPNSQDGLKRLDYRLLYEARLRDYLLMLDQKKMVILTGDLNVAHQEIDLKNPETNRRNPGFSDEEREAFTALLDCGFIDTFRYLYPDTIKYTWWSYRFKARERNIGWRIDYFVVSKRYKNRIKEAFIDNEVFGSDHCPVGLIIE